MQFDLQEARRRNHYTDHQLSAAQGRPLRTEDPTCDICHPVTETPPRRFRRFWNWIGNEYQAETYTAYTVTNFATYLGAFGRRTVQDEFARRILLSIRYRTNPALFEPLLLSFLRITTQTDNFRRNIVTNQQTMNNQPVRPQQQPPQQPQQPQQPQAAGANNLQLQAILQAIFGQNGQNITNLTQQLQQPHVPRELTLVKVEPFYGKDDEDPHEWIELFNQAATANRWPDNRKVAIAAGLLRDAAHDWYVNDQANIQQWHLANQQGNFDERFIEHFSPETKQNQWYYELMTIRQTSEEKVDEYCRRFRKLLRKVNTNNLVPDALQVRMFLYGLNPLLTPLVSTNNPANLNAAMERAKVVETGYNYVPTKQISLNVPVATVENPTINAITQPQPTPKTKEPSPGNDIELLTQQMQQLSLNYANLSAALLAQTAPVTPAKPKEYRNEKMVKIITCYKCGKPGHIARECFSRTATPPPTQTTRFQTRRVNYLDNEYDASEDEEEAEVYLNTRSRSYNKNTSESGKEQRLRKRIRTGDEMDEGDDAETYIPAPATAEAPIPTRKRSRRKMKPAPIENVTEFDIAQYIKDLPCGLTIGQASAQIPKY